MGLSPIYTIVHIFHKYSVSLPRKQSQFRRSTLGFWSHSVTISKCFRVCFDLLLFGDRGSDRGRMESASKGYAIARLHIAITNVSRIDQDDTHSEDFEEMANTLRKELEMNKFFINMPIPLQKKLLKGERACIYYQDEILNRMGEDASFIRGYYRFLSSHIHSYPLGFYRMADHWRGHGRENDIDKGYISSALEFCTDIIKRCTDDMQRAFSEIAVFSTNSVSWKSLTHGPKKNIRKLKSIMQEDLPYDAIVTSFVWDIKKEQKGAIMFLDIPYYMGDQDSLEYLTLTVAKNYSGLDQHLYR